MPAALSVVPSSSTQFNAAAGLEFNGALMNNGALVNSLQALSNNANPALQYSTSAAATITITNLYNAVQRLTNGGAVTVTLDNAINVVNAIPGPFLGQTFEFDIAVNAATTVAAPTVTNTGITLSGTTTVTTGGFRRYQGQITQLFSNTVTGVTAGTTFTSIAQIGTSNLYTLTLVTNAITSVVGNLIWIGVTAGTLPAGFYETMTAGTTTIVVALPINGTAWTATAATMTNAPTVVPQTYAPLITLTGMYGMSAGVIVV
jgi:hypothetical protein